nr:MAG TPA: hypothetical protein [Caudoviricetes sp.]
MTIGNSYEFSPAPHRACTFQRTRRSIVDIYIYYD